MRISGSLLFALCVASPSASSEIFKCAGDNGYDKYQNFPCAIDSIGSKATAAPPPTEGAVAAAPASARKQPAPGMKMSEVRAAWGAPGSTDVANGAEIWYYEGASGKMVGVRFDPSGTVRLVGEVPKVAQSND